MTALKVSMFFGNILMRAPAMWNLLDNPGIWSNMWSSCFLRLSFYTPLVWETTVLTHSNRLTSGDLRSEEFTFNWVAVAAVTLMDASVGKVDIIFSPVVTKINEILWKQTRIKNTIKCIYFYISNIYLIK